MRYMQLLIQPFLINVTINVDGCRKKIKQFCGEQQELIQATMGPVTTLDIHRQHEVKTGNLAAC